MSANLDPLNLTLGFLVGIISGLAIEEARYRHQKRLSNKERLLPLTERMLGIATRIRRDGKHAMGLETNIRNYRKFQGNAEKDDFSAEFLKGIVLHSFDSLRGLVEKSREFEDTYLELTQRGMLETIGIFDKTLYDKLIQMHQCTETFSQREIKSLEEALEQTIITRNLTRDSEDLEKSLRSFIIK